MRRTRIGTAAACSALALAALSCRTGTPPASTASPEAGPPAPAPARRRGQARVEELRPRRFPHRIWAACDFEARTPSYGWFGTPETHNIPRYSGNRTALRARGPYRKFAALMVGINPVPGPRMGAVNKMYCRYLIRGSTRATFQHFSLSVNDNNHIRVSGLTEGRWSEVTLNFTRDGRRNDGTPGVPFKKGERMDDLKIFVGKPGDGRTYEMLIDDVIFFSEDPDEAEREIVEGQTAPEPFPRRVIFLAAFDTGVGRPADIRKFWPGEFQIARRPPAGAYWVAAKAKPRASGQEHAVVLKLRPQRTAGEETKLRFRYWLKGAAGMKLILHDASAGVDRTVSLTGLRRGKWVTRYVNFTRDGRPRGGKPLAAGNRLDALEFVAPGGGDVELYIDEAVLFDAGRPHPPGS